MRYKAVVTLEYLTGPPDTVRAEIVAGSPGTAASRAVKAAKRAHRGRRPSSIVVVLEPQRESADADEAPFEASA